MDADNANAKAKTVSIFQQLPGWMLMLRRFHFSTTPRMDADDANAKAKTTVSIFQLFLLFLSFGALIPSTKS